MKFITFTSQAQFGAWHAEINTLKGFPNAPDTLRYTTATEGTDSLFYAAIRDSDVALLEDITSPYVEVVGVEEKNAAMPVVENKITV